MRLSKGLVLCVLAAHCCAQVLVEHSAAAAGGAMGALAGKAVSDSVGAATKTVNKVADDKTPKAKPETAKVPPRKVAGTESAASTKPVLSPGPSAASYGGYGTASASAGMTASGGGVTRQNRPVRQNASLVSESTAARVIASVALPIPVHHASREEVTAIQAGTSRSDVIAKLGPPASLVTIPDEGHLLETFKYVSGNSWIGTVRLDNGAVVKVDSPQ